MYPASLALAVGILLHASAASTQAPDFEGFAVKDVFTGTPVSVDLSSHAMAREYRTVLRTGAAKGPNFAGHYTIVEWGCGSNCHLFAIVDAVTGKVFVPLSSYPLDLGYRLESRLLVVNPGDDFKAMFGGCPDHAVAWKPVSHYYEWRSEQLTHFTDVDFCKK